MIFACQFWLEGVGEGGSGLILPDPMALWCIFKFFILSHRCASDRF